MVEQDIKLKNKNTYRGIV